MYAGQLEIDARASVLYTEQKQQQPLICFGKQKEIAQHRTNEYHYREIKGLLIIAIVKIKIKINKTPNIFLSLSKWPPTAGWSDVIWFWEKCAAGFTLKNERTNMVPPHSIRRNPETNSGSIHLSAGRYNEPSVCYTFISLIYIFEFLWGWWRQKKWGK